MPRGLNGVIKLRQLHQLFESVLCVSVILSGHRMLAETKYTTMKEYGEQAAFSVDLQRPLRMMHGGILFPISCCVTSLNLSPKAKKRNSLPHNRIISEPVSLFQYNPSSLPARISVYQS
ncbi:hypothetical protein L2E82_50067 [Cichorium intybus]|nr:hypothetical protein L2E82_50067 [Cichorium intybus]